MSEQLPFWVQIVTGLAIVALLFFFGPSAWLAAQNSPKGTARDWMGLALPVGGVILVVVVLIALARG